MADNLRLSFDMSGKKFDWLRTNQQNQYSFSNNGITVPFTFRSAETSTPSSLIRLQETLPTQVKDDVAMIPEQVAPSDPSNPLVLSKENWRRIDVDKNYRKEVKNQLVQQYMQHGTASDPTPMTKKQAEKLADAYIKNLRNQANFMGTVTYVDEGEFEAAKKARKAKKDELIKQYRAQGMSKGDAKRHAEWELARVERIKNDDALRIINDPQYSDLFIGDDGKFSSAKLKQFTLGLANAHTGEDEVTNYHLSLKERREMAAKMGWDDDALCELANKAGLDFEKDYTEVLQLAVSLGGVAIGAGVSTLFNRTVDVGASAADDALAGVAAGAAGAGASSSSSAAAGATIHQNRALVGAGIGGTVAGLVAPYVKDPGGKEDDVIPPGKPKPEPPEDIPEDDPVDTPVDPEPVCELTPEDIPVAPTEIPEETCTYTLKRGQTLYDAVKHGYGLKTHKEVMQFVHEIKDRYGIDYSSYTNRTEWEMPEINGKKFNCDVEFEGTCTTYAPRGTVSQDGKYTPRTTKRDNDPIYTAVDCDGNRTQYSTKDERDAAVEASKPKD